MAESIFEVVEVRNQARTASVATNNSVENLVATGFTLQVGRSCRGPQWKLQPMWMKNRTSPGWGGKQPRRVQCSRPSRTLCCPLSPTLTLPLEVPRTTFGLSTIRQFPDKSCHTFGTAGFEGVVSSSFASPISPTLRVRRCGRNLDVLGHHRSAWSSRAQRVSSVNCSGKNLL